MKRLLAGTLALLTLLAFTPLAAAETTQVGTPRSETLVVELVCRHIR
ncbi:MAG: hypothetical protein LBS11_00325 [Oscillospiraceae bacterium]|jgi:hypothetical protein|nr:hypothetical protein [Oscillospiraceae bacterium]